jgi:integrase
MSITRHAGTGRWLFQFDKVVAGKRQRANKLLPAGITRKEAQAYDQQYTKALYGVAAGVDRVEHLIEDAVLLYLKHHAPKLKNFDDIEAALAIIQPAYAGRPLTDLPDVAREYATQQAEILKPGTVKNRLAYLRAACRWAWKHHSMGEHDPAERMILPKVRNARQVYLERADMLRIARQMKVGPARAAMRVGFYSGMRAGEVLTSTVVSTGSGLALAIASDASKNDLPRLVPVHPRVAHLVRGCAANNKEACKPVPTSRKALAKRRKKPELAWPPRVTVWTVSKETKAAMKAVGLDHARLHDLRHSAASEMINAGIDLYTVGGVLGHKSAVSTQRYAHLATAKLAAAVATIGRKRA